MISKKRGFAGEAPTPTPRFLLATADARSAWLHSLFAQTVLSPAGPEQFVMTANGIPTVHSPRFPHCSA